MDYTAYKNSREDESEGGFKNYVFEKASHWIFVSLHAHTSRPRRFGERFHTSVFAITDKDGDKKVEFSCKGDFGMAEARGKKEHRIQVSERDEEIMEELWDKKDNLRSRVFNVGSPGYRPSELDFEAGNVSHYEEWINGIAELCTKAPPNEIHERLKDENFPRFVIDIRDPITARAELGDSDRAAVMMNEPGEANCGFARTIIQQGPVTVGEKYCRFEDDRKLSEAYSSNGEFYTDPYCKKLLDGPGPEAVRQYLEPGFRLTLPITNKKPERERRDHMDTKDYWTMEFEVTPQQPSGARERFFQPQTNLGGRIDYRIN